MENVRIYDPRVSAEKSDIDELDTRYAVILAESSMTDRFHNITEEQSALMAEMFESM